jgi:L-Ala-D/L-Glu epimerase
VNPRVGRLSWQSFRVPMRRPFAAAHGPLEFREGLVVRLETDSGITGLGEASPLPSYAGGSLEEAAEALEILGRAARGRTLDECWSLDVQFPPLASASIAAARCGFETATADAAARKQGVPLWAWLSNAQPRHLSIPANAVIDAAQPGDAARQAAVFAARGFSTFKVKVGTGRDQDVARVRAVRSTVGSAATIRVDANGAWDEDTARAVLGALAPLDVALCEQPLPRDPSPLAAMARLRADSSIPLAADESCRSLAELEEIIRLGAADAVVVKPMVTGLRPAVAMLDAANMASMPVIVTTTFDSAIGVATAMHLAALLPAPPPACGLATLDHLESPLAEGVPSVRDGVIELPPAPGLGVSLDVDALCRYAGSIAGEVAL